MPAIVANLFRSSSNSTDKQSGLTSLKESVRNRSSSSRPRTRTVDDSHLRQSFFHYPSADSDNGGHQQLYSSTHAAAPATKMMTAESSSSHHLHRLSFAGLHLPGRSSKPELVNASASLDWKLESPPIIFHNDADSSSGALVSGQLLLNVKEEPFEVEAFRATLSLHVHHRKPFQAHCADCQNQYTIIKEWTFLSHPISLAQGEYNCPILVLLVLFHFATTWLRFSLPRYCCS